MKATSIIAPLAAAFLVAFGVGAPMAHAEIGVTFECTIPSSTHFDCNLLRQRFLKDQSLPYVKEGHSGRRMLESLKVSVSRVQVANGFEYAIVVTDKKGPSNFTRKVFLSDGTNPVVAVAQINKLLQQGVNGWAFQADEASVEGGDVAVVYRDPFGAPVAKKSEGRWILKPGASFNFKKFGGTPSTYSSQGEIVFDYSGDRVRVQAEGRGWGDRQNVTVSKGDQVGIYGVSTRGFYADASTSIGLDSSNHFNLGVNSAAYFNRLENIEKHLSASVGLEYNVRPTLKKDSMSFAVGCRVGPEYYNLEVDNYLGKNQVLALSQVCSIVGSFLVDKQRGTTVTGRVGENWLLSQRDVAGVSGKLSANLKITDRWALSPSINVSKKTKSIAGTSPDYAPSFENLSAKDSAEAQLYYGGQATSGSTFSATADVTLSYTFGDGITRSAQDQRGVANLE